MEIKAKMVNAKSEADGFKKACLAVYCFLCIMGIGFLVLKNSGSFDKEEEEVLEKKQKKEFKEFDLSDD
mgnify:CR=1 FL=1